MTCYFSFFSCVFLLFNCNSCQDSWYSRNIMSWNTRHISSFAFFVVSNVAWALLLCWLRRTQSSSWEIKTPMTWKYVWESCFQFLAFQGNLGYYATCSLWDNGSQFFVHRMGKSELNDSSAHSQADLIMR
jgi:hypothetical protein